MKLALVQYTSIEIEKKSSFIIEFSNDLELFFKDKDYGSDIKEIVVGVICVSLQFEHFFKPRKLKYIKEKKHIKSEGFEYEIDKCLMYDIKLDFDTFKNYSEIEAKQYLAKEIVNSFAVFDLMKSKIKDFDSENFKEDLESYFKEKLFI